MTFEDSPLHVHIENHENLKNPTSPKGTLYEGRADSYTIKAETIGSGYNTVRANIYDTDYLRIQG